MHILRLITQSERLRNEETQQHRDIENRSTNMIENQFLKQQEKITQIEKPHISTNSNENLPKWGRNITLTVGDSILSGIVERRISRATIDDMYNYMNPLLKKCPDNIMLGLITRLLSHPK